MWATLLCILLAVTTPAWAIQYYFSREAGANDSNPCTQVLPCSTLTKADSLDLNDGDQVLFRRGDTWTVNQGLNLGAGDSGAAGNPVIIGAYGTGAKPIFDGTGSTDFARVDLTGTAAYITVQDLELIGTNRGVWIAGTSATAQVNNIILQRLTVTATVACIQMTNVHTLTSRENRLICGQGGSFGESHYVGSNPTTTNRQDNITITQNYIGPTSHEGIELKSITTNVTITNNTIETTGYPAPAISQQAGTLDGSHLIRANWIKNPTNNAAHADANMRLGTGGTVEYNLLTDGTGANTVGIRTDCSSCTWSQLVRFNTIYNPVAACTQAVGGTPTFSDNIGWLCSSGNYASDPLFVNAAGHNYNLQAGSPARGQGAGGTDDGAFQAISFVSATVQNATPNVVNVVVNSVFPLAICNHTGGAWFQVTGEGSARSNSSCTVTGNASFSLTFAGNPLTSGQQGTISIPAGRIKASPIGCTLCPGAAEYVTYVRHESIAMSGNVQNNVAAGGTPSLVSCVVSDSDRDAVTITLNSAGSSPMLPATGATGFVAERNNVSWPVTSTCSRVGSTDSYYCDMTTDAAGGETIEVGYAGNTAGPRTVIRETCDPAQDPLSRGGLWRAGAIDTDATGDVLAANGECRKNVSPSTGSKAWETVFDANQEAYFIIRDAEGADGNRATLFVRLTNPNTATPDGYECRVIFTSGVDTIQIYRMDDGFGSPGGLFPLGTAVNQEFSNNDGMLCRADGTTIEAWYYNGATWSLKASVTDSTYTSGGRIGFYLQSDQIAIDNFGGGNLVGLGRSLPEGPQALAGEGNVTNQAGSPVPISVKTCTNNIASAPAAPVISGCQVDNATPDKLLVTINTGAPPMLPASGAVGLTARLAGATWSRISTTQQTATQYLMSMVGAAQFGQAIDVSYDQTPGNITDSTPTELLNATNFACTNNVLPNLLVLTQTATRCHEWGILPTNGQWLRRENAGCQITYGGQALLALQLAVTGDTPPPFALRLQCADGGGSPYLVQDTFGAQKMRILSTATFVNNDFITSRLLSTPPSSVYYQGRYVDAMGSYPVEVIAAEPADTERVFSVEVSPSATPGDTIACRLVLDDGTAVVGPDLVVTVSGAANAAP